MNAQETEIERLKAAIAQQEIALTELEAEIIDLERDLQPTIDRYNRLVAPKIARLDVLKKMIADLESDLAAKQQSAPAPIPTSPYTTWSPPENYVPVEEQFRRTWRVPLEQAGETPPVANIIESVRPHDNSRDSLKRTYRELARRYHPDLTTDPVERERRNRLMAEINAAYASGDSEALQVLAAQDHAGSVDEPLKHILLRQLQQVHHQLTLRIDQLQSERLELLNGEMMWMKIQSSLAARQGKDYFRDMAATLDAEYASHLDRMVELRGRL